MSEESPRYGARGLQIAKDLRLPLDAVTQTFGIIAKRRAGKSYLVLKMVEQLWHAGQQVVVIDPKGDTWGLRYSSSGKSRDGLPIVILGGEHGDVRLEASGGEVVARMVVEDRVSAVLDLSEFRKHEVATFATGFLETLYRLKAREQHRTAMMLVVDEADAIAPQRPLRGEERMLGAAEDIVRRGGQRGIGCIMATQRAAVLNKNVLTQVQVLVALRTIAPQDLDAMNAWVDVHGTTEQRRELMTSLPALPVGTAWIWSPGWPTERGIFKRVQVGRRETYDSGATPKAGERRADPKGRAEVDLAALSTKMAATIERTKADDPRELRRQISELRRELEKTKAAAPAATVERVEVPVLDEKSLRRLEAVAEKIAAPLALAGERSGEVLAVLERVKETLRAAAGAQATVCQVPQKPATRTAVGRMAAHVARSGGAGSATVPRATGSNRGSDRLPSGERVVLTAVAQHQDGVTRQQLTILTGYKRSTRDAYLQRLREKGLVDTAGDRFLATDAGISALGPDFEPLPTGDALREHWLRRLPEGEARILRLLSDSYPRAVVRERLSEVTGYARSSRDAYVQRLVARRLVVSIGRGEVRASEELFG